MEGFLLVCVFILLVMGLVNRSKQKQERREDQAHTRDLTTRIYFLEEAVTKLKKEGVAAPPTKEPVHEPHVAVSAPPPPKPAPITPPRPVSVEPKPQEVAEAWVKATPPQVPLKEPTAPTSVPDKPLVTPAPPVVPPMSPVWPPPPQAIRHEPVHVTVPPPRFTAVPPKPVQPLGSLKSVLDVEQVLGKNWLNKFGIGLVVLGIAFFLAYKLPTLPPLGKVLVGYATSGAILGGGIWLERKDRYRILARAGVGGGWALLFFTTYALYHIPAAQVLESQTVDLVLLLIVAGVMVWHTLHYRSQVVTGLAYLLAFLTVAISHSNVYSLTAGGLLAAGLVVLVGRYQWYELEVFGILASYLNHYLWLRPIIEPMQGLHHPFPEFPASAGMLLLYWLIFRLSYVFRNPSEQAKERVSTIAALLNPALLLALLKYQSAHPEWAFWGLLAIGTVETVLGQLPITRRRRTAVIVLSTLGVVFLIAAFPFRYSGMNLSMLWLLEAEALVLIGILAREIVFRRLGLLAALLVSGHMVAVDAYNVYLTRAVANSATSDIQLALVFAVAAILFYSNAHWASRRWAGLFVKQFDRQLLHRLSYVAGLMVFIAVWLAFSEVWTAVAWCAVAAILSWAGQRYALSELFYQANVLSAAAVVRVFFVNLYATETYSHLTLRSITLTLIAVFLYLTAHWSWETGTPAHDYVWRRLANSGYTWTASSLLGLLAWYELNYAVVAVVWAVGSLVLALMGRRLARPDLTYQGNAAAVAAVTRVALVNYDVVDIWQHLSVRLLTVTGVAVLLYISSRWSWVEQSGTSTPYRKRFVTASYTWAGTALLGVLAWYEVQFAAVAVVWAFGGLALALVARRLGNHDLTYQANALGLAAFVRTIAVNYSATEPFQGVTQRLASVVLVAVLLYVTSRWGWVEEYADRDFFFGAHPFQFSHVAIGIYLWAGSFLLAFLAWYELQPVGVAVAWALGGLVLLELGFLRKSFSLRAQGYIAFLSAFARIFYVNLNAGGDWPSPRLYTVIPIVLTFFYAYWRLLENKSQLGGFEEKIRMAGLCCWLGTIAVAALLRFELPPDWVATGWAALALVLLLVAWVAKHRVFLYQAILLSLGLAFRTVLHNFYQGSYIQPVNVWQSRWVLVGSTVVLLFLSLPLLFRLRKREADTTSGLLRKAFSVLDRHPEQLFFFIAVGLLTVMLALETSHGKVTLAWGLEGLAIFMIALLAGERSFRLTGLGLLLLCVVKILFKDVWLLQPSDRYLTLIVLGAVLVLVSFLYTRYSEAISRYL